MISSGCARRLNGWSASAAMEKLFLSRRSRGADRVLTEEWRATLAGMVCVVFAFGLQNNSLPLHQCLCVHHVRLWTTQAAVSPGHAFFAQHLYIFNWNFQAFGQIKDRQVCRAIRRWARRCSTRCTTPPAAASGGCLWRNPGPAEGAGRPAAPNARRGAAVRSGASRHCPGVPRLLAWAASARRPTAKTVETRSC